jgi:integrase
VSVHPYKTSDGTRFQVRWREGDGRVRTRSLKSKKEAIAFDADVKARKFKGDTLPRPGRETLAAAFDEWWRLRGSTLSAKTQEAYKSVWRTHISGRFDHHHLSELASHPQLIEELTADMRERGVGNAAQRKVLAVLSAVLTSAVQWRKISHNPVLTAPKPPGTRRRHPRPMPPVVIERIRLQMLQRTTKDPSGARNIADACMVTLMSYAGLRPGEALALTWADVGKRTLAIDKAVSLGVEGPTKTGGARSVPLVDPLAADLHDLWTAQGEPGDDQLILPARNGGHWSRSLYDNWRNRVWKPVMGGLASGDPPQTWLADARPYDCRGSFVSLRLRAGDSPIEVAEWAGHSPQVMFQHYANVIKELVGEPTISAEDQIRRARETVAETPRMELDRLMADLFDAPQPAPVIAATPILRPRLKAVAS